MPQSHTGSRRRPIGAELLDDGVSFRVWAPDHPALFLVLDGADELPMKAEPEGYFSLFVPHLKEGARYRVRLGEGGPLLADPASRYQPEGPKGPSVVVDASAHRWSDTGWQGIGTHGQVLYEMHVGTFTEEGTWAAAAERLPLLKEIGITTIEMMPINEFEGEYGWGYDGVLLYAPYHNYGSPDDLRAFIDRAHALGLGVILDVVYNHFGPGEICPRYASAYYSSGPANEWGKSMNFDEAGSEAVRDYMAGNAAYWIDEFHFDGLRIDATQALLDKSEEHIVARMVRDARAAAGDRRIFIVSENEPQEILQVIPAEQGGHGLDALWNDDFHHSATVALTGRGEAYYHDHKGTPAEFVASAKYGYLFQGQRYDWQNGPRGMPGLDVRPEHFVHFLQNHDQVANSARGLRVNALASPARLRAMTALLLLGPQSPMLFQGQEFWATTPFFYFLDQQGEGGEKVHQGRIEFLAQFPSIRDPDVVAQMAVPAERDTFVRSKLDWTSYSPDAPAVRLHRDLLALRCTDTAFSRQPSARRGEMDASVIGPNALLLRFFADLPADERLLLVNFGDDLSFESIPDPLVAPPQGCDWRLVWTSENPAYGGSGQRAVDLSRRWLFTANTALVFGTEPAGPRNKPPKSELDAWQDKIQP